MENYERYVILTWMHVTFYATWIRVYTFVIWATYYHSKQNKMKILKKLEETVTSAKHISLAVNEKLSLHTRLLVWSFTDVVSIIFSFSWCSVVHHPICAYDFGSLITLCFCIFCNMQDNLDQHVDSMDCHVQVTPLILLYFYQPWIPVLGSVHFVLRQSIRHF